MKLPNCLRRSLLVVITLSVLLSTLGAVALANTKLVSAEKQQADFYHVLYTYFQNDFVTTLGLIDKAYASHSFQALSQDDKDRLALMRGASQLNLGLYNDAQQIFLDLLSKATSDYVQANTWYWLAKAGFDNKQQFLSEQAYQAITQGELEEYLEFDQWQELSYLAAHNRMQSGDDWQSLLNNIHKSTIFPAYLLANDATKAFNNAEYEQAREGFILAKQALITHQRAQSGVLAMASELSRDLLDIISPWRWFSSDPNQVAERRLEDQEKQALREEQSALFDHLNLNLTYTLLQQQDDENALAVINQVSHEGGESQQAILTLGWTLAQQNRWSPAITTWRHLRQNETGLFGLQASYGLAYAYQQQGLFADAYYALEDTINQISESLDALGQFKQSIDQATFLDTYQTQWPDNLLDVKRLFLSSSDTQGDFDAKYLLGVRQQSVEILQILAEKQAHLDILNNLLQERELAFKQRGDSLSLEEKKIALSQAAKQIQILETRLSPSNEAQRMELMISMLSPDIQNHHSRLAQAEQRHQRLLKDPPRGRPLKPSYAERLARLEGILRWQMEYDYIANRWQHKRLLDNMKIAYEQAQKAYDSVVIAQQDTSNFAKEYQRINRISGQIEQQKVSAQRVFETADARLKQFLHGLVDERVAQLEQQYVNTRLARIRLQDMRGNQPVMGNSRAGDNP
ncbi:hypothetical protein [Glaciecola sp. 1036]|uniref:hypothetical protein n=1 Tax=Alteromonadaceae TaxID=72275 RepID=UPI003CFF5C47